MEDAHLQESRILKQCVFIENDIYVKYSLLVLGKHWKEKLSLVGNTWYICGSERFFKLKQFLHWAGSQEAISFRSACNFAMPATTLLKTWQICNSLLWVTHLIRISQAKPEREVSQVRNSELVVTPWQGNCQQYIAEMLMCIQLQLVGWYDLLERHVCGNQW